MFEIAHVNSLPPRDQGMRVLVTRKWPRGIPKQEIDLWVKELGAPPELLRDYKKAKITKAGFQARYIGEITTPGKRELADNLQRLAMNGKKVILCCDTEDDSCSVRKMLKEYLEQT